MKSRLSLKALQDQINVLNKSNKAIKNNKATDLKTNSTGKVQEVTLHMRSSFMYMYALSWILFLANKIPFIAKIATLLRLYYGKTSFWRMLLISRKLFIAFNALVGVVAVLKCTGMETGSVLANFTMIGSNYIELLSNLVKNIFNWIFDLFDYKIVPNVPNNTNNSWWPGPKTLTWGTKPMITTGILENINELKDIFPSPLNTKIVPEVSGYRDWSTWLWYTGVIVCVTAFAAIVYTGFSYYQSVYNPLPGAGPA